MIRRLSPFAALLVLTACGPGAAVPVTTTSAPAGPATTTTVAYKPGAGLRAWNRWIKTVDHLDVSRISKSDCGAFAMVATVNGLTFYMWDGLQWRDVSSLLGGGHGSHPSKIWTLDFTRDGILDFFVVYDDERLKGHSAYGAYLAFPWTAEGQCEWSWVDVDNGRDIVKTVESPEIDERESLVRGKGHENSRWTSYGRFEYQSSSHSFVWSKEFAKNTP